MPVSLHSPDTQYYTGPLLALDLGIFHTPRWHTSCKESQPVHQFMGRAEPQSRDSLRPAVTHRGDDLVYNAATLHVLLQTMAEPSAAQSHKSCA